MSNLSSITRATLRDDLRARLNEVAPDKFTDPELNQWINIAQFDVFVRLVPFIGRWYGEQSASISLTESMAGSVTAHDLSSQNPGKPADIYRLDAVIGDTQADIEDKVIPIVETLGEVYAVKGNSNYDYACCFWGEKLYTYFSSSLSLSQGVLHMYYLRKPDELTSDSDTMDLPDEYADLVIMTALSKALGKLRLMAPKEDIDRDISERIRDIERSFGVETQMMQIEEQSGIQTPRVR